MRAKIVLSVPSMLDRKIPIQNKFDAIFLSIAIDCDQPPCQVYGESWIADGRDRWRSLCFFFGSARCMEMEKLGRGRSEYSKDTSGELHMKIRPQRQIAWTISLDGLESKICVGFAYKT
jgi:hypothetical protein